MKELGTKMVEEAGKKGVGKAIDLLFDKYVNPKLEKIINSPQDILYLEEQFKTYLNKRYDIDKYINTIVFSNENKTIEDLYIPLTIIQNGKRNKLVLNKTMKNIFSLPIKYLIIDTAGTGKSTLVKFLSTHCIENSWGYPFVIELRRLEKDQSIEDYILKDVQLICEKIKYVDIKDLIRRGDFIFFLDGYDEITEDKKDCVTETIRKFVTSADCNSFIITSRDDDLLNQFGDFTKFCVKELSEKEAYELIRRYDNYGDVSKNLIEEIEKDENFDVIKEFLGNPLLVSLLYMSYEYNRILHHKKSIFYRQVYDALYFRHDSIKGNANIHEKKSKLDLESFRKVLCAMGFLSVKQGKVEFTKDEIIQLINDSVKFFPDISTDENCFLHDILQAVPLFKEEGVSYKWVHKSFSEYFASVFICQEYKQCEKIVFDSILNTDNNQRFYNMLDFCYDIDYKAVIDYLICPVLERYISFCDDRYKNNSKKAFMELENFYRFVDNIYFVKVDDKPRPKDRDTMNDYADAWRLLRKNGINTFSYLSHISKSENIVMSVHRKPEYEIIKLLFRKNVDIFKKVIIKDYSLRFLKNVKNIGIYNVFSDNMTEASFEFSREEILSLVFRNNINFRGNILDLEKCRLKLKELKEEQNKISKSFFSLT